MKRTPALYWKIFISTFTLSAFTFGGGYVIVPLMQ
ncbi:MAG: chromate transporter, partial [Oscillospiraceae bacterium]|nr:chromate transporter [Oscillospiraceae bacterium]